MVACTKRLQKKRVVTSQDRLSEELQALFNETYPKKDDIENNLIRIDRPDGTFICCVPLETEDTSYLVKIKVVIDKNPEESLDRDDDMGEDSDSGDMEGADELADTAEDESED